MKCPSLQNVGRLSFLLLIIQGCLLRCIHAEIRQASSKQSLEETSEKLALNLSKNCNKSYSATCLKLDVTNFVDKLSEQQDLGILPGVSIVKESSSNDASSSEIVANITRDFPNDIDKRLDAYLVHKVGSYLKSHTISIKLFDPRTFKAAKNFNEETLSKFGLVEGRKKDKGGMNGMMAGLMMMKGTLGALGFGALAMLAGKALMTGLMALMLSAIVGLKSLSHGGGKKTTYEIVSKPVYTSAHTHSSEEIHAGHGYGHSGYGRSLDEVHETVQEAMRKYGSILNRKSIV